MHGLSSWLSTFVMLENIKEGSWLVAPSLPSSYLFGLQFHQLYLSIGILGSWNRLYNTIVSQDNRFQNIL